MKYIVVFAIMLIFVGCSDTPQERTTQSQPNTVTKKNDLTTDALPVQKDEAQAIAEQHLRQEDRDLSKHRLGTVRLVPSSSWMKGQHWIVTWELKSLSDGGQVFVFVDMEKRVRVAGGL